MTGLKLECQPNTSPMEWSRFLEIAPDQSIAIDGYVLGEPKFNLSRRIINANHHENVDRLATRCTAAQIAIQVRMGLMSIFDNLRPTSVFFNDCDQDVCLSIWLLRNSHILQNVVNPILNRILAVLDMLDTTAGAFRYPADMPAMEENNWIFLPYSMARKNGALVRRGSQEFIQIIDAVGSRISNSIAGRGEKLPLDVRYEKVGGGANWSMVHEIGENARTGMFQDGIQAFISFEPMIDGRFRYVIWRSGIWVRFPVPEILKALSAEEGHVDYLWGGGDTVGGSNRAHGSHLTPDQVTKVVEKVLISHR